MWSNTVFLPLYRPLKITWHTCSWIKKQYTKSHGRTALYSLTVATLVKIEQPVCTRVVLTCLERLSLVWVCGACWACCVSMRACCPAALLRRVWGWELTVSTSVEQEALDELSSTEAAGQKKTNTFQLNIYCSYNEYVMLSKRDHKKGASIWAKAAFLVFLLSGKQKNVTNTKVLEITGHILASTKKIQWRQ